MSEDKTKEAAAAKQMTAAEAAKRVKCKTAGVLAWRDYGTHVVVVTTDGQKLTDAGE